jgi:hypothetical protein
MQYGLVAQQLLGREEQHSLLQVGGFLLLLMLQCDTESESKESARIRDLSRTPCNSTPKQSRVRH